MDDTLVVYASLGKFLNKHLNHYCPQIEKVIYFGDGLSAQHKTIKNLKIWFFPCLILTWRLCGISLLPHMERMLVME